MSDEPRIISGVDFAAAAAEETDAPKFNVSRLSWKDTKRGYRAQMAINKAHAAGDVDMMDEALAGLEHLLARATVYVPRSWLVEDAPKKLKWDDPASFDWLQGDKFSELLAAMNAASTPQAASKN